jgi:hypothetical protein
MTDSADVRLPTQSVLRTGFALVPINLMTRGDLSPAAKLVYGYLSHLAWRGHTDRAATPLAALVRDLNVTEKTVRGYLNELATAPTIEGLDVEHVGRLLTIQRRGLGMTNLYILNEPLVIDDSKSVPGKTPDQTGRNLPIPVRAGSLPVIQETLELDEGIPPAPLEGGVDENRPAKVNGTKVKDTEYALAIAILAEWNRQTHSVYRDRSWIEKIIRRIRERPELSLEAHALVIERSLASPWWGDDAAASPAVIYGNAGIFERSVHSVRVPPKPRDLSPDEIRAMGRQQVNG